MHVKVVWKIAIVVVIAVGAWWGWSMWKSGDKVVVQYETSPLKKMDLRLTIDSTGTVEPTELVEVSAQVTGTILELGKDLAGKTVDYASEVKQGQLLARIDDVVVKSDIKRAEASIAEAKANIAQSEANIVQAKAEHEQAKRNRERAEKLGAGDALSQAEYDQYIYQEEAAGAAVKVAEASLEQAKASLQSAEAALVTERRNLEYTTITSPVDGTIITRLYNVGSTVVSNMSATTMFYVAKNLDNVQVWASVNEADIGSIHPGQEVVFSVDAYPGRSFSGTVNKVRPNATMTSNVVVYVVEVDAKNPNRVLRPYMTANVNFITQDLKDAFVVPNAALRFQPTMDMIDPACREAYNQKLMEIDQAAEEVAMLADGSEPPKTPNTIWERRGNYVAPVWVIAGESNGMVTPVASDELREDMDIVIAVNMDGTSSDDAAGDSAESTNPFLPQMPKRDKNKKRNASKNPPPPPGTMPVRLAE